MPNSVPRPLLLLFSGAIKTLTGIALREANPSEKDNCHLSSLMCGIAQRTTGKGRENRTGRNQRGRRAMRSRVMGVQEGAGRGEHWVLHTTDVPLNTTSETNGVLYVG